MTEEAQIIALCHWFGINCTCLERGGTTAQFAMIPNIYSLDVLHEMEKKLTQGEKTRYIFNLQTICEGQQFGDSCFASASQRLKALLRTLGLLRDS